MRFVILTVGLAVGLAGTAGEARAQYVLPGSYSSYYPGAYGYDGGAVYGGYTPSYYGYTPALGFGYGYGYPAYGYGAGRYGYSGFRYGYGSPYGGYRYGYRYGYRGYRY